MSTIYDLIEVSGLASNTTYSIAAGNLTGVVASITGTSLSDGEFDVGDNVSLSGTTYRIDRVVKPTSTGFFTLGDGSTRNFFSVAESNLDVVFLQLSAGSTIRYFVVPNDRFGAMAVMSIRTGTLADAAGNDAAIISTVSNLTTVVCFTRGTLIEAKGGRHIRIEKLRKGDLVMTADHGLQRVQWIGSRRLTRDELAANERLRPVRIDKGALGKGLPERPIKLSPQHRVMVSSRIAERMFETDEVLVAAKHLAGLPGVQTVGAARDVEYFHILFDRHEIVFANGLACESLYLGQQAVKSLAPAAQAEIMEIFPELRTGPARIPPSRLFLQGRQGRKLAERHEKNRKPLCVTVRTAAPHPAFGRG